VLVKAIVLVMLVVLALLCGALMKGGNRSYEISDPAKKRWSELVRKTRQEFDETQAEFSRRFGVSSQSVQQWEAQGNYPKVQSLAKMADLLGWSTDTLNRYLETGHEVLGDPFDVNQVIAQLKMQDATVLANLINSASDILLKRLKQAA
jgi:transcriptional regulator with XRE-family HTH domain